MRFVQRVALRELLGREGCSHGNDPRRGENESEAVGEGPGLDGTPPLKGGLVPDDGTRREGALTLATGFPAFGLSDIRGIFKGGAPSAADLAALKDHADGVDVDALAKLLRDAPDEDIRKTVREFHDDFAELIEETGLRALVVFIDDLDRCSPTP